MYVAKVKDLTEKPFVARELMLIKVRESFQQLERQTSRIGVFNLIRFPGCS